MEKNEVLLADGSKMLTPVVSLSQFNEQKIPRTTHNMKNDCTCHNCLQCINITPWEHISHPVDYNSRKTTCKKINIEMNDAKSNLNDVIDIYNRDARLPLKKRRISIYPPYSPKGSPPKEISYPAEPMLSIAALHCNYMNGTIFRVERRINLHDEIDDNFEAKSPAFVQIEEVDKQ